MVFLTVALLFLSAYRDLTQAFPDATYYPPLGFLQLSLALGAITAAVTVGWVFGLRITEHRGFPGRIVVEATVLAFTVGCLVASLVLAVRDQLADDWNPFELVIRTALYAFFGLLFLGLPFLFWAFLNVLAGVWLVRRSLRWKRCWSLLHV
jgi:hypothetical protein